MQPSCNYSFHKTKKADALSLQVKATKIKQKQLKDARICIFSIIITHISEILSNFVQNLLTKYFSET